MKKVFILSLAAVGMLAVSCKKGPVKANKLEGTWEVSSSSSSSSITPDGGASEETETEFDGTVKTTTTTYDPQNGQSYSVDQDYTYSTYEYQFSEDGTVTITEDYTYDIVAEDQVDVNGTYTQTDTYTVMQVTTGKWNIQDKYNEEFLPNDRISIDVLKVETDETKETVKEYDNTNINDDTETTESSDINNFAAGTNVMMIQVSEMDKESMSTTNSYSYTDVDSDTGTDGVTTTSETVYEGNGTMTLTKIGD